MDINEQFQAAITKKVLVDAFRKHINLEDLIKELAPKIKKEISANILSSVRELDWIDYVQEAFCDDKEFQKMLRDRIVRAFK